MEIFSANLAYLALLGGIFFAVMAFITPGTGLLEIITMALLFGAGYGMTQYGVNPWALLVLLGSFVPLYYALRRPKRYLALAAASAGLAGSALFLFPSEEAWSSVSVWVAIPGSLIFIALVWFIALQITNTPALPAESPAQNLAGKIGEAKSDIHLEGSVQAGGQLWSARSETPIPSGSFVRILRVDGLTLIVAPLEHDTASESS